MIVGNAVGAILTTPKTIILVDEDGKEIPATLVDKEQVFTASKNDIRQGKTAVTEDGLIEGEKNIPTCHTYEGYRIITKGSKVTLPNIDSVTNIYDYTKLQTMICLFNKNEASSVSTEKVSIGNSVYNVNSTEPISVVTKNHDSKIVDFGITNDSDTMWILRFFMYKEIE